MILRQPHQPRLTLGSLERTTNINNGPGLSAVCAEYLCGRIWSCLHLWHTCPGESTGGGGGGGYLKQGGRQTRPEVPPIVGLVPRVDGRLVWCVSKVVGGSGASFYMRAPFGLFFDLLDQRIMLFWHLAGFFRGDSCSSLG